MSDHTPPADLVAAQREYYELERRCHELAAKLPPATAIVNGEAEPSAEVMQRLTDARAKRGRVLDAVYGHPWWETVPPSERLDARRALQEAARDTPKAS